MQHWQKDRMKLVISILVFTILLFILIFESHNTKQLITAPLIACILPACYWGYRWAKGNINFKNPNKNNP